MAVKWHLVQKGDQLWQKKRTKMGNTTMSRWSVFGVRIIEIDHDAGMATVSWNTNAPTRWGRSQIEKLSRKRPEPRKPIMERIAP